MTGHRIGHTTAALRIAERLWETERMLLIYGGYVCIQYPYLIKRELRARRDCFCNCIRKTTGR